MNYLYFYATWAALCAALTLFCLGVFEIRAYLNLCRVVRARLAKWS